MTMAFMMSPLLGALRAAGPPGAPGSGAPNPRGKELTGRSSARSSKGEELARGRRALQSALHILAQAAGRSQLEFPRGATGCPATRSAAPARVLSDRPRPCPLAP